MEDKHLQAADFATQAARMWVRMQRYKEAEIQLRRAMQFASAEDSDDAGRTAHQVCGKAVVALVIVKFVQEDSVAANKVYGEAMQ